jgi:ubiquinone/menaquinone biosynthesis C-methylase UbiE
MVQVIFPKRSSWGDEIFKLENGSQDDPAYVKIVESCGLAYFHKNPLVRFLFKKRIRTAYKILPKKQFKKLFDAGCGIGYFLPTLSRISEEVVGIDYHGEAIDLASILVDKLTLSNVKLQTGSLLSLPFRDALFDGIVSLSVLEHIEDLDAVFQELSRVARKDAEIVFGFPMEDSFGLFPFFEKLDHYTCFARHMQKMSRAKESVKNLKAESPGHVSNWKTIDDTMQKYFTVIKKSYLSILPGIGKIYAFRHVHKI